MNFSFYTTTTSSSKQLWPTCDRTATVGIQRQKSQFEFIVWHSHCCATCQGPALCLLIPKSRTSWCLLIMPTQVLLFTGSLEIKHYIPEFVCGVIYGLRIFGIHMGNTE